MTITDPYVQPTAYTVNCLPEDAEDPDGHSFALTVGYCGDGAWGVFRSHARSLDADGVWSWGYAWAGGDREPATDEEWDSYHRGRDAWLAARRFDLDTALRLAKEAAPHVTVNGHTVAEALAAREQQ